MEAREKEQEVCVMVSDKRNKGGSREQALKNIYVNVYVMGDKRKDGERGLEDVYVCV